jgi:AcrR family transcriptional regulator
MACQNRPVSDKRSLNRPNGDPVRNQLIAAAIEVVTSDGLTAATTRRISEQAGLSLSTFHYWFSNKEELFECVLEEILSEFEGASTPADGAAPGEMPSAVQLLRSAFSVVTGHGEQGSKRQIVPYELTVLALRTPAFRDFARRQYELYRQAATKMAGPMLDNIDPRLPGGSEAVVQLVTALFDGLTLAWLADPEGTRPDEVFQLLEALLLPFSGATTLSGPDRPAKRD